MYLRALSMTVMGCRHLLLHNDGKKESFHARDGDCTENRGPIVPVSLVDVLSVILCASWNIPQPLGVHQGRTSGDEHG